MTREFSWENSAFFQLIQLLPVVGNGQFYWIHLNSSFSCFYSKKQKIILQKEYFVQLSLLELTPHLNILPVCEEEGLFIRISAKKWWIIVFERYFIKKPSPRMRNDVRGILQKSTSPFRDSHSISGGILRFRNFS